MSFPVLNIDRYKVLLGQITPYGFGCSAFAMITVEDTNQEMEAIIYFFNPGTLTGEPRRIVGDSYFGADVDIPGQFEKWVDILRNEKPLQFVVQQYNGKTDFFIRTGLEDVGEGDGITRTF